ncbi:Glycosyl transferase [Macleaya cordata]|uniref:Glycosyl transferase n=1 Tax=Macleaya cordata TaxID=56857 RepID=A0A200PQW2_MACCD|nr:Glycosyl transferase [Macleaya cordata]
MGIVVSLLSSDRISYFSFVSVNLAPSLLINLLAHNSSPIQLSSGTLRVSKFSPESCQFSSSDVPYDFSESRYFRYFSNVRSLTTCFFEIYNYSFIANLGADSRFHQRNLKGYRPLYDCKQCIDKKEPDYKQDTSDGKADNRLLEEDIYITATYTDASGAVRINTVKSKDLSASWVWQNPDDESSNQIKSGQAKEDSSLHGMRGTEESSRLSTGDHGSGEGENQYEEAPINPVKLNRRELRQQRKELRSAELIQHDKDTENLMEAAAIERSKQLNTSVRGKYSIWRREYENPNSDSTLKLIRDQIIMAKAYASIAKPKNELRLYDSLMKHIKDNQRAIGEASSDAELHPSALDRAKAMGLVLSMAKDQLYDSTVMARKLRAMLQSTEESINSLKKKSAFLIQLAAKTVPKPLHCLPLQLATDYFLQDYGSKEILNKDKLEDPSLYHYAIFSDNVLATSVVVNSTVLHANEPEKHVFHIVTDKLNFAAMKMWFLISSPAGASIQVENIDDFKWLNSSYCSVLRQLESARIKEYYFKANHPSSLSDGSDNLKYRNPKYLSMLNHLRFYLPEVYPKLDKILFLDDDIVVQKDLTPLWSIDLQGMVNGAVETCKESFHRFDKYLNFSNPKIYQNFDPNACGWAFGMNIFDLKEWKKRDITGIYHHWQDMNEDRTLWKLGSLPPGLITFYNLTYPLDRSWHVLGLGYDPALNQTEIENAAVIHYNGNYKPWLDLAVTKYKSYWSRYVMFDNPYLQHCNINYE